MEPLIAQVPSDPFCLYHGPFCMPLSALGCETSKNWIYGLGHSCRRLTWYNDLKDGRCKDCEGSSNHITFIGILETGFKTGSMLCRAAGR